jgi:hypothetical protein
LNILFRRVHACVSTCQHLQGFHSSFKRCRYDLTRWRTVTHLSPAATEVLDAKNGAGWALAEMLLRPRKVQVLADGHVYFTNEGKQRPSAEQALKAPFVVAASEPSSEPIPVPAAEDAEGTQPRQGGGFFGLFRRLTSRITSLENDVMKTVHSWNLLHVAHSHVMLYKSYAAPCTLSFCAVHKLPLHLCWSGEAKAG